jgi:hypothetical protein
MYKSNAYDKEVTTVNRKVLTMIIILTGFGFYMTLVYLLLN